MDVSLRGRSRDCSEEQNGTRARECVGTLRSPNLGTHRKRDRRYESRGFKTIQQARRTTASRYSSNANPPCLSPSTPSSSPGQKRSVPLSRCTWAHDLSLSLSLDSSETTWNLGIESGRCCYVPLEPDYPRERLETVVRSTAGVEFCQKVSFFKNVSRSTCDSALWKGGECF